MGKRRKAEAEGLPVIVAGGPVPNGNVFGWPCRMQDSRMSLLAFLGSYGSVMLGGVEGPWTRDQGQWDKCQLLPE